MDVVAYGGTSASRRCCTTGGTRERRSDETLNLRTRIGGDGPVVAASDATGWQLIVRGQTHSQGVDNDDLHDSLRQLAMEDRTLAPDAFGVVMNCEGAWEDDYTEEHGEAALTFENWMERIEYGGVTWIAEDGELCTSAVAVRDDRERDEGMIRPTITAVGDDEETVFKYYANFGDDVPARYVGWILVLEGPNALPAQAVSAAEVAGDLRSMNIDDEGIHYLLRSTTETMLEHLRGRTQSEHPADADLRRMSELTTQLAELTERGDD
jgi:hypothetical protein